MVSSVIWACSVSRPLSARCAHTSPPRPSTVYSFVGPAPQAPIDFSGSLFHPPDVMSKTTSPSSSVRMLHHSTTGRLCVRGRGEPHLAVEQVSGSSIRGHGLFPGAWDRTAVSLCLCLMRPCISSPLLPYDQLMVFHTRGFSICYSLCGSRAHIRGFSCTADTRSRLLKQ